MAIDRVFVNGVIAVKENSLLRGKILKMCEGTAEEAFRTLVESGFAHGAELTSVYDYEQALVADERDTDSFIREYSPSVAVTEYFFAPRDYHNAKALVKADYLNTEADKMLAPDGIYSAAQIKGYIDGVSDLIDSDLKAVIDEAKNALQADKAPTGADVGVMFERALNRHLIKACKYNSRLKKFLIARADMTDILAVMRSSSEEHAKANLLSLGKLPQDKLLSVFGDDEEKILKALDSTPYKEFWRTAYTCRQKGLPQTEAERILSGLEEKFYYDNRYSSSGGLPFMYYVFRRRAENQNVRIVLSCLIAGVEGEKIKSRLRSFD